MIDKLPNPFPGFLSKPRDIPNIDKEHRNICNKCGVELGSMNLYCCLQLDCPCYRRITC